MWVSDLLEAFGGSQPWLHICAGRRQILTVLCPEAAVCPQAPFSNSPLQPSTRCSAKEIHSTNNKKQSRGCFKHDKAVGDTPHELSRGNHCLQILCHAKPKAAYFQCNPTSPQAEICILTCGVLHSVAERRSVSRADLNLNRSINGW